MKPEAIVERLFDLGVIEKMGVTFEFTGEDSSNEYVWLNTSKHKFPWSVMSYLDVGPGWPRSIARLKEHYADQVRAYRAWLKKEARDLAEYRRLQAKFQ